MIYLWNSCYVLWRSHIVTLTHTFLIPCATVPGSPLVVSLIGALLKEKPNRWRYYLGQLQQKQFKRIRKSSSYDYDALDQAMAASIEVLPDEHRELYKDFTVLEKDIKIPAKVCLHSESYGRMALFMYLCLTDFQNWSFLGFTLENQNMFHSACLAGCNLSQKCRGRKNIPLCFSTWRNYGQTLSPNKTKKWTITQKIHKLQCYSFFQVLSVLWDLEPEDVEDILGEFVNKSLLFMDSHNKPNLYYLHDLQLDFLVEQNRTQLEVSLHAGLQELKQLDFNLFVKWAELACVLTNLTHMCLLC